MKFYVGHRGMARLQAADGGDGVKIWGSSEYIEKGVADSRQGLVLWLWDWIGLTIPYRNKSA
jgi:hypothetical protein